MIRQQALNAVLIVTFETLHPQNAGPFWHSLRTFTDRQAGQKCAERYADVHPAR
jgi:hypothetical protein